MPTTDNDQWVSDSGGAGSGTRWQYLNDNLGDAAETLIDPAVPNMALALRGPPGYHFQISPTSSPPESWLGYQDITFTDAFIGSQDGIQGGITQVLTSRNDTFGNDDFFALQGGPPQLGGSEPQDSIWRNDSVGLSGGSGQWGLVTSTDPSFGPGMIAALGASGGHEQPTLYVLTSTSANYKQSAYSPGKVYKGKFTIGNPRFTYHWSLASGFGFDPNLLKSAASLIVNPYDPNELYVTDLGDSSIRVSRDGGLTWAPDATLKDVATNHGEFDFDCGYFPFNIFSFSNYHDKEIFGNQCPLMQIVFLRDQPDIRVAVLYPGGIAFSRDGGFHWIPLNVTNEDESLQPIELPESAFYDPTQGADPANKNTDLYIALEGHGLKRVEGPFATLESGNVSFCVPCALPPVPGVIQLKASIDEPFPLTLSLHLRADGLYQADFPFDSATTGRVAYHINVNGAPLPEQVQTLTHADVSAGVVALTNLPPPVLSMAVAAVGTDGFDLTFQNEGLVRLPRVDVRSIQLMGESSGTELPITDNRPLGEILAGGTVTIRIPFPGLRGENFEVTCQVFVEDLAGRDAILALSGRSSGSNGTSK